MKLRILLLLLVLVTVAVFAGVGVAFQSGTLRVSELDGSPNVNLARWLVFPNSALSCSGDKCTFTGISSSIAGAEGANATLTLSADESDDNGDDWTINSVASGNALTFANDTSGSQVTKLSLSTAGVLTLSDSETITNASDVVTVQADDAAGAFVVAGFEASAASIAIWADEGDDTADKWTLSVATTDVLSLLNGATTLYQFSTAGVLTLPDSETVTNASDVVTFAFDDAAAEVRIVGFEGGSASITLQADESDDNGDDWKITTVTGGNALNFSNDVSGSQVVKLVLSTDGGLELLSDAFLSNAAGALIGFDSSSGGFVSIDPDALGVRVGGTVLIKGDLTGDGADQFYGFLQNQIASTTTTLTVGECGSTIVNNSADVLTLPEASTALGCRYTFIVGNVSNFDVNPENSDQIVLLTDAAGDAIRADAIGESVTLEAISASAWAPVGAEKGTWSDVN